MATTPNMNLTLPIVSETPGPTWASNINESLNTVDEHNHTAGHGIAVPTAGLNIDADLPVNDNSVIDMTMAAFTNQVAEVHDYTNGLYALGGDLYWNNGDNNAVQITDGNSVAGGGGGGGGTPVIIDFELFVSKNGNDLTGDGSLSKPFLTITGALAHASVNFAATDYIRINVAAGTYTEDVTIDRQRTSLVGANTNPEDFTTVIAGSVVVNCPTATSRYQDVVGITNIYIAGPATAPALWIAGSGAFLVDVNGCYITAPNTDQFIFYCNNTNITRCVVYIRNSIILRYASSSTATVIRLQTGDVRMDNVRIYASVTGTSKGIEVLGTATLFANNIILEKNTTGAAILVATSSANTSLILTNSSVSCFNTSASASPALSLYNSIGIAGVAYQTLLTTYTTTDHVIAGAPNGSTVTLYYSFISYGGANNSNAVAATSVQLPNAGVVGKILTPVRKTTTDATPIALTTTGLAAANYNILLMLPYSASKVRAEIVARDKNLGISGSAAIKAWTIEGLAYMDATAATAGITGVTASVSGAGLVGASADLKVDTSLGGIYVEATGIAATNISWTATIYATEVSAL